MKIDYKTFRKQTPKLMEPYQETEEELWVLAQKALLDKISTMMYGMVVNGNCQPVLLEKDFNMLLDDCLEDFKKYKRYHDKNS